MKLHNTITLLNQQQFKWLVLVIQHTPVSDPPVIVKEPSLQFRQQQHDGRVCVQVDYSLSCLECCVSYVLILIRQCLTTLKWVIQLFNYISDFWTPFKIIPWLFSSPNIKIVDINILIRVGAKIESISKKIVIL